MNKPVLVSRLLPPLRVVLFVVVAFAVTWCVAWNSQSRFGVALQVVMATAVMLAVAIVTFLRQAVWLVALAEGCAPFQPYGPYRSHWSLVPGAVVAAFVATSFAMAATTALEQVGELTVWPRVPILLIAGALAALFAASRHRHDSAQIQGVFRGTARRFVLEVAVMLTVLCAPLMPLLYVVRYGPQRSVAGTSFSHHTAAVALGLLTITAGLAALRVACEHRAGTLITEDLPSPRFVRRAVLAFVIVAVAAVALWFAPLPEVMWWPGLAATIVACVIISVVGSVAGAVVAAVTVKPNPWRDDEAHE
jgi:hypothetical protein